MKPNQKTFTVYGSVGAVIGMIFTYGVFSWIAAPTGRIGEYPPIFFAVVAGFPSGVITGLLIATMVVLSKQK